MYLLYSNPLTQYRVNKKTLLWSLAKRLQKRRERNTSVTRLTRKKTRLHKRSKAEREIKKKKGEEASKK